MYHILIEVLLLVIGFQTSNDEISKCEAIFDPRKISKSILLAYDYIDFECGDSAEIRFVSGNNNSPITAQGETCRIGARKRLDFSSYQVASCDSNRIRFRRNYIRYFSLSQNQVMAILYDTIRDPMQSAYSQSSSSMPIMSIDLVNKRKKRERMQAAFGMAGAVLLFAGIIYVVNNVEIDVWKMPDP